MDKIKSWQRYTGLLTVGILWFSILTAIYKARLDLFGKDPLSSLGIVPASAHYFSIGLILAAVSILVFSLYLSHVYKITKSFMAALFIGQLGQIVAALSPYGGQQPAKLIHTYAAFTLAFSIPVLMWRFAVAQKSATLRRRAYLLMWSEIAAFIIGIGTFIILKKGAPIGQALPAVAFHIWILFVSFDSFKRKYQ